ncbi:MAG: TIM barrel protein [Planctomycetota bacterium]
MRLGGPVFEKCDSPDAWVAAVRRLRYSAAFCPVEPDVADDVVAAYRDAADTADIVIAEVGAWSNPISPDDDVRRAALEKCEEHLALADRIGARCCVNVAGSRGEQWAGPDAADLTNETFDLIVESVRAIIDAVKPVRTFYTLETMPWLYPDSADSYVRLIEAIDRAEFAVHLDPVNLVNSVRRHFNNAALLRDAFDKLGPHIKSCHAKDTLLRGDLTVRLDEVRPGMGALDYETFLTELNKLDPDTPLLIEHLASPVEFILAAAHIRGVAKRAGVTILD